MANVPTPHNDARLEDVAGIVLMPGDPLRAEHIAKTYLDNVRQFNAIRNMLGYTGTYRGRRVSVMGSGMGMPSIGIYSYELFEFYQVGTIIRIGSAGAISDDVKLRDIVVAMGASTNSNYVSQYDLPGTYAPLADYGLLATAVDKASKMNVNIRVGNVLSTDIFYDADASVYDKWRRMNVLAVEMEAAALYMNAAWTHKRALGMFTISDHLCTGGRLSAKDRQETFGEMMEVALETAYAVG